MDENVSATDKIRLICFLQISCLVCTFTGAKESQKTQESEL